MTDVTFAVIEVEPEPYAVTPILNARLGIAAVGDEPIHAIALRCQVRIEPHAARLLRRRGRGPGRPVRAAGALGHHHAHFPVAADHRDGAGLHRRHAGQPAAGMHLRLRGGGFEVSARPARRHGAAAVPVQRNGFLQGTRGFAVQQVPWDREDRFDMPVSVWRDLIAAALSEHRLAAAEPGHRRRAGRLPVGTRAALFDDAVTSLLAASSTEELR